MRPEVMVARYRVTTPMFSAGADPKAEAELRPASFKGALRFWFRALAWAEFRSVEKVRAAEDQLFGSTRTGQAQVLLSLTPIEKKPWVPKMGLGLGYLAGQGLVGEERKIARHALDAGTRFEIRLLLRTAVDQQELLRKSLRALGLLGGLGARARRGFGSLLLEELVDEVEPWTAPRDLSGLTAELRSLLPPASTVMEAPPYTALSGQTRIVLLPWTSGKSGEALLERAGKAFLHFRSYGVQRGDARFVGNAEALPRFEDDHDEMLKVAQGRLGRRDALAAPRRAVFGLPHNYYFKSIGATVSVNGQGVERRASPLWFHVHHVPDAPPVGILSFLPAMFLPGPRPELAIQGKGPIHSVAVPEPSALWQPIEEFLCELLKRNESQLCEKFPGAVEVK